MMKLLFIANLKFADAVEIATGMEAAKLCLSQEQSTSLMLTGQGKLIVRRLATMWARQLFGTQLSL